MYLTQQVEGYVYEHYDDEVENDYDGDEDDEDYSSGLDDWEDDMEDMLSPSNDED